MTPVARRTKAEAPGTVYVGPGVAQRLLQTLPLQNELQEKKSLWEQVLEEEWAAV